MSEPAMGLAPYLFDERGILHYDGVWKDRSFLFGG